MANTANTLIAVPQASCLMHVDPFEQITSFLIRSLGKRHQGTYDNHHRIIKVEPPHLRTLSHRQTSLFLEGDEGHRGSPWYYDYNH